MLRKMVLALVLVVGTSLSAVAVPTITVGDHALLPNMPGQVISILASGSGSADEILGVDLFLVVGGGTTGPIITSVDLVGPGTLLNGNANPQQDFGPPYTAPAREVVAFTTTLSGTVGPDGVLGFVTLDTTGITSGDFSLSLTSDLFGPSALLTNGDASTVLVDGTLSVVPEPASVVLGLFAAAGLAAAGLAAVALRHRARR